MVKFIIAFLQACGIMIMLGLIVTITAVIAMFAGVVSAFAWFIGFGAAVLTGIITIIIFTETT